MEAALPEIRSPPAALDSGEMSRNIVKSILDLPTPRPPSPYKPGKVSRRCRQSVLPSLFEFKLDMPRRRDKQLRLRRDAEEIMEKKYLLSFPVGCKGRLSRSRNVDQTSESQPEEEEIHADPKSKVFSSCDIAMREYLLLEAQQEQLFTEENDLRNQLIAHENYGHINIYVDFLHFLPRVIAEDHVELAECAKKDEENRAEERHRFCRTIETEIAQRFFEAKLQKKLYEIELEMLPEHAKGLEELAAQEKEEWEELMEWHYKRLKRYGQVVRKMVDYRGKSRRKKVRGKIVETIGEKYLRMIRERNKEGQLIVVCNDPSTAVSEALYAQQGRSRLQREREKLAELQRIDRALVVLIDDEPDAREEVQQEESKAWVPLMFFGIDGHYEAKRAARERQELEELQQRKEAGDEEAKAEMKRRLLAKEFIERKKGKEDIESVPWTPDVVPCVE